MAETVEMLKAYSDLGFSRVVGTPHWAAGMSATSSQLIDEVRALAHDHNLRFSSARECRIHPNLVDILDQSPDLRIDGGEVVLVELPWGPVPYFTVSVFGALIRRGYRPVLVHPERHESLWKSDSPVGALVDMGVLLQVNLSSIIGQHGSTVFDQAISLLQSGVVAFVAGDSHSPNGVKTGVSKAIGALETLVGLDATSVLIEQNPYALMANQPVANLREHGLHGQVDVASAKKHLRNPSLLSRARKLLNQRPV